MGLMLAADQPIHTSMYRLVRDTSPHGNLCEPDERWRSNRIGVREPAAVIDIRSAEPGVAPDGKEVHHDDDKDNRADCGNGNRVGR